MKKTIILLILGFCLNGCYNYTELNDLSIVAGLGIDYIDNNYYATVEILNSTKESSEAKTNSQKSYLISGSGSNIEEAIFDAIKKDSKIPHYSHLEIVIIGEEVAKNKLNDISDFLIRDNKIRNDFLLVVSKASLAADILKSKNEDEQVNSFKIIKLIENLDQTTGTSLNKKFDIFIDEYLEYGIDSFISSVILVNNKIEVNNIAVFKDLKLIDYLNEDETKIISLLSKKTKNTYFDTKCNENNIFMVNIDEPNIKIEAKKNNVIDIDINASGRISEINCSIDLKDYKKIEKLEKLINKKIKDETIKTINQLINLDTDVLGFGLTYYRKFPKIYEKKQLEKVWKNFKYNINVNVSINKKGVLKDYYKGELRND